MEDCLFCKIAKGDIPSNKVYEDDTDDEDDGDGICFNIFAYNAQPQVEIDYKTGDSREE